MNAGPDVERRISAWLDEEVPTRAPDRVLATAFERSRRTHQRRFGAVWRTWTLPSNTWRLAAAAVVAVIIFAAGAIFLGGLSGGGVGGPGATPTPTPYPFATDAVLPSPSIPPLTETFTSNLHGYSVKYPAGWTATQSTAAWSGSTTLISGSPGLDDLLGDTARLTGTSQPLAAGQTAEAW